MPNKNLLKILIFAIISPYYLFLAGFGAVARASSQETSGVSWGDDPCASWTHEVAQFAVEHLCVVQVPPGDDRPLYVGTVESRTYKFLFSDGAIALALPGGEFEARRQDESWSRQVLQDIPPDRLSIWYSEALYWWRWLKSTESEWSGKGDPV